MAIVARLHRILINDEDDDAIRRIVIYVNRGYGDVPVDAPATGPLSFPGASDCDRAALIRFVDRTQIQGVDD